MRRLRSQASLHIYRLLLPPTYLPTRFDFLLPHGSEKAASGQSLDGCRDTGGEADASQGV